MLRAVLRLDVLVEDVVDDQRRAGGAGAEAAGADDRRRGHASPVRANSASMASFTRAAPEAMQPAPMQSADLLVAGGRPGGLLGAERVAQVRQLLDALAMNLRHASSPLRVAVSRGSPSTVSRILATRVGLTRWWTSSSIMITGARPQAPKQRPTSSEKLPVGGGLADFDPQQVLRATPSTCLPPRT